MAALAIGLLLLVLNAPQGADRADPCAHPFERGARAGWSVDVGCAPVAETAPPLRGPARILFDQGIALNQADARALEVLPGIGPSRAAAIVRTRRVRPFRRIEDLDRVPGIGPRTISDLRGWISIGARDE